MKSICPHKDLYLAVPSGVFTIALKWGKCNYPSMDKWVECNVPRKGM